MKSSNIHFHFLIKNFDFKNRTRLKKFINLIFKDFSIDTGNISIIFCSDKYLKSINQKYLNHDYYTDIITFQYEEFNKVSGDIFISIDRIRGNSKKLGNTIKSELHRVIFHGILHLCGFNDKTSQEITNIRATEDHYLRLYFSKK